MALPQPVLLPPRTAIALSARDLNHFFPGPLQQRLQSLLPAARQIDPHQPAQRWHHELMALDPEIIITGWDGAAIPPDLPNLRYVCHVMGTVRNHIDRALIERGVLVTNWGGIVAETVAEAALAMILASLRRCQHFGDLLHTQRSWVRLPAGAQSLFDRRVGIHGFGHVARRLVPMLRPFRCVVRAFTEDVPEHWYKEHGVERAESLAALFEWSDVLVEAEGLTPATRGVVDETMLRRLRPGSTFVNVARGALVDETALAQIAAEGKIRVALDVYDVEPLPVDSPLRGLTRNVTLFPHVGGPTDDRFPHCGEFALRNLAAYLDGKKTEAQVTLDVYDRAT